MVSDFYCVLIYGDLWRGFVSAVFYFTLRYTDVRVTRVGKRIFSADRV